MFRPSGDQAGEVASPAPPAKGPGRSANLREAVPSALATYSVVLFVKTSFWSSGDHAPPFPWRSASLEGEPPSVGNAHNGVEAPLNPFSSPTSSLDPSCEMLRIPNGVPGRAPVMDAR